MFLCQLLSGFIECFASVTWTPGGGQLGICGGLLCGVESRRLNIFSENSSIIRLYLDTTLTSVIPMAPLYQWAIYLEGSQYALVFYRTGA